MLRLATCSRFLLLTCLVVLSCMAAPRAVLSQLRVVTYNTLDKPSTSEDLAQVSTILQAIGATPRNGVAKRPDIIALQEQRVFSISDSTAARIAEELNSIYGVSSYSAELQSFSSDALAVVYDSASVALLGETNVNTPGPRNAYRLQFRPVGYTDAAADFYLYNSHLKAGSSSSDKSTRALEVTAIRNNADNLGSASNVIYLGDMNISYYTQQAYSNFLAAGDSQAHDPLDLSSWPNISVAEHMTQSTRTSYLPDGGATGGMDDRFDMQLVTDNLLDGEGLSYLGPTSAGLSGSEHSYQAFGNDGVSYNTRINNTYSGRSQSASVLDALHDFSDHLPVVADYQLPAVLEVLASAIPETLEVGEAYDLDVSIRNAADVVAAIGADELDYMLTTSGDLSGAFSGSIQALDVASTYPVAFDTSTPGHKSGLLTVSTSSQGAANALFELPISFEVQAAALPGDFNTDGRVDAADYTVWRDGLDAEYDQQDYDVWRMGYGATSAAIASPSLAPSPAAMWLLTPAFGLAGARETRASARRV